MRSERRMAGTPRSSITTIFQPQSRAMIVGLSLMSERPCKSSADLCRSRFFLGRLEEVVSQGAQGTSAFDRHIKSRQ